MPEPMSRLFRPRKHKYAYHQISFANDEGYSLVEQMMDETGHGVTRVNEIGKPVDRHFENSGHFLSNTTA
jgi:hypothetical protein